VVSCPKCGSESVRKVGKSKYLCEACGTFFYACPVCSATFFSMQELGGHVKRHREEAGGQGYEDALAEIRDRLGRIEERLDRIESILSNLSLQAKAESRAESSSELPSYARDNPWLRILSRR
jgi:uncharacterized Zn finger protein (UPF0148 family)